MGHLNVQTTRGHVAVFDEDVVRHYQEFLDRRRAQRPASGYRAPTETETAEFEEHFEKRRVELGSCDRPYGTACQHEHTCLRCQMLSVNPKMLPRLDELDWVTSELIDEPTQGRVNTWDSRGPERPAIDRWGPHPRPGQHVHHGMTRHKEGREGGHG